MEPIKEEERDEYLDFLLRHYRLVDAYWFLAVEKDFGLDAAVKLDEDIWEELSGKSAREIKRRFGIEEKGLDGFVRALSYYPWTRISGYRISREDDKVVITVPACPPQVARIKSGMDEFSCKEMHRKDFESFAREIDERIEVRCVHAPPDSHPEDCFCRWEFTVRD